MTKDNEDALRCADVLRQLDDAKKHHPSGPGGQMMGCESYRLIASGFSFYELQNAADHLDRLVQENEAKDALLRQAAVSLKQAKDAVDDWGSYASEHFQKKHNLQGDLDEIQEFVTAIRQHLDQKTT